ncbi:MAG TPA: response regulator transcription factor [Oculatellaceae cyanobacterium]
MGKILVVEDEADLALLVRNWLEREKHLVEVTDNGADALSHLRVNKFDVVILDLMLPELSGMEVCRRYRQSKGKTPILMLTAKSSVEDKEAGLDAGADDYLTKPFNMKELAARVRALIRRASDQPNNMFTIRDIVIDADEFRVTKGGIEVHLLPKEFRLLEFLVRHPHQVFSADDLLASVWESDTSALLDTVRGHIKRLRKKLDTAGQPSIISTVYGIGYRLEPD